MSSDADYAAFLEKANQDTGASESSTKASSAVVATKAVNTEIPVALQKVEKYYVSDADEPFGPVSLKWDGKNLPSKVLRSLLKTVLFRTDEFRDLIDHKSDVSVLSAKDFDPRGEYDDVLDAVKKAGSGDASVFRIRHGSTRAEYYVVSLDEKSSRIVGLKAKAVES
ncbi:MAG: hypothetical protein M1834_002943 [Cirrosporium novae-zelandiae]|nr:MAG: hypothetical protein M1834_002943 [Cirrosporium novae-zelandiae]